MDSWYYNNTIDKDVNFLRSMRELSGLLSAFYGKDVLARKGCSARIFHEVFSLTYSIALKGIRIFQNDGIAAPDGSHLGEAI